MLALHQIQWLDQNLPGFRFRRRSTFITLIPVALIRNPDWEAATVLSLATLVYVVLTAVIFALGLTRYRRGEVPISGV